MERAAFQPQRQKDVVRPAGHSPVQAGAWTGGLNGSGRVLGNLQRTYGNTSVQRLLDKTVVQRTCACGGGCSSCGPQSAEQEPDAELKGLQRKTVPGTRLPGIDWAGTGHGTSPRVPSFVQAKLTVSQPGDQYEQEADRVAAQVMRVPDGPGEPPEPAVISRYTADSSLHYIGRQETEEEEDPAPEVSPSREDLLSLQEVPGTPHDVDAHLEGRILDIRGGGRPLTPELRAFYEPRFGVDFSGVRIHTDSGAAETAQRVGARAYTLGSDIAFAPGEYRADSQEGRALLAHELTHVVQQGHDLRTLMRACDCKVRGGSAPTTAQHSFLSGAFPNLNAGDYCVTAPATPTYNCFAWSVSETSKWIDKEIDSVYGNKNGTLEFSDFDAFYKFKGGLTPVVGSTPADPKVALYATGSTPTHAARKTGSGDCSFESKLGKDVRITHDPTSLEGGSTYGDIARFYV